MEQQKIIEKISQRDIVQLQKELKHLLAPQDLYILTKYFYLDEFLPEKRDLINIADFAQIINIPVKTVYQSKVFSLKKLRKYYLSDNNIAN